MDIKRNNWDSGALIENMPVCIGSTFLVDKDLVLIISELLDGSRITEWKLNPCYINEHVSLDANVFKYAGLYSCTFFSDMLGYLTTKVFAGAFLPAKTIRCLKRKRVVE